MEAARVEPVPFKDAELKYEQGKQWRVAAREVLEKALAEKYHERTNTLLRDVDELKLGKHLADVAKMEVKDGILNFKNNDDKTVYSIDLKPGMREVRNELYVHDCDLCRRRSQRLRRAAFRHMSIGEMRELLEHDAGPKDEEKRAGISTPASEAAVRTKREPDPTERAFVERERAIREREQGTRAIYLSTVEKCEAEEYEVPANISPKIRTNSVAEFEADWQFVSGNRIIEGMFGNPADKSAGYTENPFHIDSTHSWNHATLVETMQIAASDKILFSEVADKIYTQRYEEFKKRLAEQYKIPDAVIKLLDKEKSALGKIPILGILERGGQPDGLVKTYKKLEKIAKILADAKEEKDAPEEYREIWKHRESLGKAVGILGDYIVYATKLIDAIHKLRLNAPAELADKGLSIRQLEMGPDGTSVVDAPNHPNRIKKSLHELFSSGVDIPREYTSEFRQLFGKAGRPITYQDLNGRTLSLTGEYLTESMSGDAAYLEAYKQIVDVGGREKPGEGLEARGVAHINELLELGVATCNVMPGKLSIKTILDSFFATDVELEPGEKIRFSGNEEVNMRNLLRVLSIKNLADLKETGTPQKDLIRAERLKLIRLGAVIFRNNKSELQRQSTEKSRERSVGLRFSEQQAEEIIAAMKKAGNTDEVKLSKLKTVLMGGGVAIAPRGGALAGHYEFDNGTSIDVTAALPHGFDTFAVGASIGQKIEVTESVTVRVNAAAGYAVGAGGGPGAGVGMGVSMKFDSVDFHVEGGVGVTGPGIPTAFIGTGLNWEKSQEKFERALSRKEVEAHIKELDASADAYAEVKANPSKYAEMSAVLRQIEQVSSLNEDSRRTMFKSAYELFKTGLQSEALDETTKAWYERFIPTGAGLGAAVVGGVPIPYAYLEFQLYSRNLVFRVAGSEAEAGQIADTVATQAILESMAARGSKAEKVETQKLATTENSQLIVGPDGHLMLKSTKDASMDFGHFGEQFTSFKKELEDIAQIGVEPATNGLIQLIPRENYGTTLVYIDPALKGDAVVVTDGGKLYLSVKKDAKLFVKREDVTYPFEQRGTLQDTTIVISADPRMDLKVIKDESTHFVQQLNGREWRTEAANADVLTGARTGPRQENIKLLAQYKKWFKAENPQDRLEMPNLDEMKEAYEALRSSATLIGERESLDVRLADNVMTAVSTLAQDESFIKKYREFTTVGHDLDKIKASWHENSQALIPFINTQVKTKGIDRELTWPEMNAALLQFTIASFRDLQSLNPEKAKAEYVKQLNNFHRPMFTSILNTYYKVSIPDDAAREKKVKEMVDFMMAEFTKVDPLSKGTDVKEGTSFGTLVGMGRITGVRRMTNFSDSGEKYGVLGMSQLDIKDTGIKGELASFWLQTLSLYVPGLHNKLTVPPAETKEAFDKYQDRMRKQLHSPLALKLLLPSAIVFTPAEMKLLKEIYEDDKNGGARDVNIDAKNLPVVKKFLDICDKVREAEMAGRTEVELNANFNLILNVRISHGIFKKCGNPSGLLSENFALLHKPSKSFTVFASRGEGTITAVQGYSQVNFSAIIGLAVPGVKQETVSTPKIDIEGPPRIVTPSVKPPVTLPGREPPPTTMPIGKPDDTQSTPQT